MLKGLISLLVLVVGFSVSTGADGQVVLTFAAKRAEGTLGIPHSYVRISGTTESGESIQRTFGFMQVERSPPRGPGRSGARGGDRRAGGGDRMGPGRAVMKRS